ncbi:gastrula zinc finger -like protein [Labeo rohita]|uniref:Gastrula zinc finger-like protein n=1 Tax=Labeo rohita TaxID=84645 RepID=A0A498MCT7_LABRO|nr:gastrula zinc finger -like protein [Labeo rohita]RXN33889.1 gastrula zinc finger -like protein [Labeo rohita]
MRVRICDKFFKQVGKSGVSAELRSVDVKMVFVKEESEMDTSEPESLRIKQEEPEPWRIKLEEQGGLIKVKEEQDLNEMEEKNPDQKAHDVITGEKSFAYSFIKESKSYLQTVLVQEAKEETVTLLREPKN